MLKSELIEKLNEISFDGEIELLIQTTNYNIIAKDVFSVEDDDDNNIVIIRGK